MQSGKKKTKSTCYNDIAISKRKRIFCCNCLFKFQQSGCWWVKQKMTVGFLLAFTFILQRRLEVWSGCVYAQTLISWIILRNSQSSE